MSLTALSNLIGAANSELADLVRAREERDSQRVKAGRDTAGDQPGSALRRRNPRRAGGNPRSSALGNRWSLPADFAIPLALQARGRDPGAAVSFHFDTQRVTKLAVLTSTSASAGGCARGAEVGHERYITRPGAAERLAEAGEPYIGRAGAVESLNDAGDERAALGGECLALFSNISESPAERQNFWAAVHAHERTPRHHKIVIDVAADPVWIRDASNLEALNSHVRLVLAKAEALYRNRGQSIASRKLPEISVSTEEAAELLAITGHLGTSEAFRFVSGVGGCTQHRFVAELPAALSPQGRAHIAKRFCHYLGNLEGADRGMMYTAVVHEPEPGSDGRNYHLHVIAYDRPCRYMDEHGKWDFEVATEFYHKGELRKKYPYRQKKIAFVRQNQKRSGKPGGGKNFVMTLRRKYAEIVNQELQRNNIPERYDPRSYASRNIDRTPTKHLGTSASALENAGVATEIGRYNAEIIWNEKARIIELERDAKIDKLDRDVFLNTQRAQKSGLSQFPNLSSQFSEHSRRWQKALRDGIEAAAVLNQYHLNVERAKSRAKKVAETAIRILNSIANGTAKRGEKSSERLIKMRLAEAKEWLLTVDQQVARHAKTVHEIEAEIDKSKQSAAVYFDAMEALLTVELNRERMRSAAARHSIFDEITDGKQPNAERYSNFMPKALEQWVLAQKVAEEASISKLDAPVSQSVNATGAGKRAPAMRAAADVAAAAAAKIQQPGPPITSKPQVELHSPAASVKPTLSAAANPRHGDRSTHANAEKQGPPLETAPALPKVANALPAREASKQPQQTNPAIAHAAPTSSPSAAKPQAASAIDPIVEQPRASKADATKPAANAASIGPATPPKPTDVPVRTSAPPHSIRPRQPNAASVALRDGVRSVLKSAIENSKGGEIAPDPQIVQPSVGIQQQGENRTPQAAPRQPDGKHAEPVSAPTANPDVLRVDPPQRDLDSEWRQIRSALERNWRRVTKLADGNYKIHGLAPELERQLAEPGFEQHRQGWASAAHRLQESEISQLIAWINSADSNDALRFPSGVPELMIADGMEEKQIEIERYKSEEGVAAALRNEQARWQQRQLAELARREQEAAAKRKESGLLERGQMTVSDHQQADERHPQVDRFAKAFQRGDWPEMTDAAWKIVNDNQARERVAQEPAEIYQQYLLIASKFVARQGLQRN